jgi:hypothetical protein
VAIAAPTRHGRVGSERSLSIASPKLKQNFRVQARQTASLAAGSIGVGDCWTIQFRRLVLEFRLFKGHSSRRAQINRLDREIG